MTMIKKWIVLQFTSTTANPSNQSNEEQINSNLILKSNECDQLILLWFFFIYLFMFLLTFF